MRSSALNLIKRGFLLIKTLIVHSLNPLEIWTIYSVDYTSNSDQIRMSQTSARPREVWRQDQGKIVMTETEERPDIDFQYQTKDIYTY